MLLSLALAPEAFAQEYALPGQGETGTAVFCRSSALVKVPRLKHVRVRDGRRALRVRHGRVRVVFADRPEVRLKVTGRTRAGRRVRRTLSVRRCT